MIATRYTEDTFEEALALLGRPREPLAAEVGEAVLATVYRLDADVQPLGSELETTFRVRPKQGPRLILKLSARPDASTSFDFQTSALAALADTGGIDVPRLVATRDGKAMFAGARVGKLAVSGYLQTELDGDLVDRQTDAPALRRQIGEAVARLSFGLKTHTHSAAERPVLWNIRYWPDLIGLIGHIEDRGLAREVDRVMTYFCTTVRPRMTYLPHQITHNDTSPFNMLLCRDGQIGIIDFGDGGYGPRIQDLAIAACHFARDPGRELGGAEELISAFHSAEPLLREEQELLPPLMAARAAALILINSWRGARFPADAQYIHKNSARAIRSLAITSRLLGAV